VVDQYELKNDQGGIDKQVFDGDIFRGGDPFFYIKV
jgi:hypothetical protein